MRLHSKRRQFMTACAIAAVLAITTAACGSDDEIDTGAGTGSETGQETAMVEIVEVFNGFEYYGACGNETVMVDDTRFYPVKAEDRGKIDLSLYPTDLDDSSLEGLAPLQRVSAPGPGDDVGLMLVYADGFARFESDSGRVIWLTDEEQTYEWEC